MIKQKLETILSEIAFVLNKVDADQVKDVIQAIMGAKTIVTCGAGRVGYAIRGFSMRLSHLGLRSYSIGDSNVPSIGLGDLLIVASGSGETQTIYDLVLIAKNNKARILSITGNKNSRIGGLADGLLIVSAPSKTKAVDGFSSTQPMTTLNEQCLGIIFDAVVLLLMEEMGESHNTMWERHSNLE